ncbi:class I SAM-dependent methyltransferase [Alphaproteobacteria bacterium]|nr:class I SAM-dependent methyltransferase [Alphaproteobacteria bacterium]
MKAFDKIIKCKICGLAALTDVLSFPAQHLSATFVKDNDASEIARIKVPLTLALCDPSRNKKACGHLQLREEVYPDLLYHQYFYRSSTSATMREDLLDVVNDIQSKVSLRDNDIVVDIGANDFTMIGYYPDNYRRVGFEPAQNIDWDHVEPSITKINDYFSIKPFKEAFANERAKAISCCAMFYDLADPNSFVRSIREMLAPDGMWCAQLSYLPLMLKNLNFYDICHEHLSYYSLDSLQKLMKKNGLEVIDASTNPVNGGSIRVFVAHSNNTAAITREGSARIEALLAEERSMDLMEVSTYETFYDKIMMLATKTQGRINHHINRGKQVFGLGASTKGNVLIQLFGLNKTLLPKINERNVEKVGLRTLGTDIELISEEEAHAANPAAMLVLPWYFKDEIIKREKPYLDVGGELLFPMPYVHIVNKDGEVRL